MITKKILKNQLLDPISRSYEEDEDLAEEITRYIFDISDLPQEEFEAVNGAINILLNCDYDIINVDNFRTAQKDFFGEPDWFNK